MITTTVFLFIFFVSRCNAINAIDKNVIITHNDQEFTDDSYANYNDIPKLDDAKSFGPNAVEEFYVVLIFGLVALQMNLFGSLYVIYRTYLQWKRVGRHNVPLSLRFPFYIALTDAFLSLGYTVNLSYTLVWKLPWPNPACKIIGTCVTTLFVLNMFLVGIIALTTWSRVCKEICVEFGSYDYKLWVVMSLLSIIIVASTMNNTGQQKYWCAGRHHNPLIPIIMIAFILAILMIILVCYIKVLLKIRKNDDSLFVSSYQRAHIEKRALRKLISYIFTFTLQFIPLLAYFFFNLAMIEHVLLHVLAITAINFGGIGNFVQFAINEGLRYSAQSNSETSSMIKEVKVAKEVKEVKEQDQQTISVVPEETKNDDDVNTISNFDETTPKIIIEVSKDVSNTYLEDDENIIEIRRTNINDIEVTNNELNDDDVVFYDTLSILDASTLVTAQSSDVLLNHDEDFWQELNHYTGSYKKSFF